MKSKRSIKTKEIETAELKTHVHNHVRFAIQILLAALISCASLVVFNGIFRVSVIFFHSLSLFVQDTIARVFCFLRSLYAQLHLIQLILMEISVYFVFNENHFKLIVILAKLIPPPFCITRVLNHASFCHKINFRWNEMKISHQVCWIRFSPSWNLKSTWNLFGRKYYSHFVDWTNSPTKSSRQLCELCFVHLNKVQNQLSRFVGKLRHNYDTLGSIGWCFFVFFSWWWCLFGIQVQPCCVNIIKQTKRCEMRCNSLSAKQDVKTSKQLKHFALQSRRENTTTVALLSLAVVLLYTLLDVTRYQLVLRSMFPFCIDTISTKWPNDMTNLRSYTHPTTESKEEKKKQRKIISIRIINQRVKRRQWELEKIPRAKKRI